MKKKQIILVIIFLFAAVIYLLLFHKDKDLKYVPENADILVLVDVKNVKRQYISSYLAHPAEWFDGYQQKGKEISFRDSGLKIPDFLQIFHLKNTKISEWYTIFEISDETAFSEFIKRYEFISDGKGGFKNNQFFIKIEGEKCFVGTSDVNLKNIGKPLSENFRNKILNANSFIDDGLGSISFISELRTQNFSIHLNDNEIEISNTSQPENFESLFTDLQSKTNFLEAELDAENIKNVSRFFNENFNDSANVNSLKMTADLEEVNDTIISYGYDDDFNEIEKVSYQKIVQPNYEILLQSSNPEKTWGFFQNKKWINAQNQFTAIPFQPNLASKNSREIVIKSARKNTKTHNLRKKNYIFLKNSPLLSSSLKTLMSLDKRFLKDFESLFYTSQSNNYYVKIKFAKQKLPLILR